MAGREQQCFNTLELQDPFVFFGSLVVGSAMLLMANNKQEVLLLGGVFVIGFTAFRLSLACGGF